MVQVGRGVGENMSISLQKTRIAPVMGLICAGLARSAFAWNVPANITRVGDDAGSAVVGADSAGRAHVLVGRASQTIWSVTVENEVVTEFAPMATGVSPAINGDTAGQIHVTFSRDWEIRYKRWNGTWDS